MKLYINVNPCDAPASREPSSATLYPSWGALQTPVGPIRVDRFYRVSAVPLVLIMAWEDRKLYTTLMAATYRCAVHPTALPLNLLTESHWAELCLLDTDMHAKLRSHYSAGGGEA